MASLPVPGKDSGTWGAILNDFLLVSHNSNGTLKLSAVTAAGGGTYTKPSTGIPSTDLSSSVQSDLTLASNAVQLAGDLGGSVTDPTVAKLQGTTLNGSTPTNGQVLTYDSTANAWVPGTPSSTSVNDATTSSKGIIELAGDLGGTASSPSVLKISGITLPGSAPGSAGQVLATTGSGAGTGTQWITPTTNAASIDGVTVTGTPSNGQVITASSGSAAGWTTPASAPVSSVFGRTGAVTAQSGDYTASQVTNALPTTTVTTKGDILAATASSTITRLGVGSNGQVLTAASGQTTGLQWATPSTNASSIDGVTVTGTPSSGQVITASGSSSAGWSTPAGTTDWLNVVTQYNADPTGVNDATTAIQNAINAVQNQTTGGSKGGVIYFPAGKYKISSALSITSENITLLGDGGGGEYYGNPVKITQSSTTANALTVSNAWNIIVKGISFVGPGSGSGIGISLAYTSPPSGFSALEDIYITGFGGDGLYLEEPIMSTFTRVWCTGNGGYGIHLAGGTTCSFTSCWAPGNSTGGWFASGNYHSWSGCGADGNTGNGWTLSGCQSCNIAGSGAEDNTAYALYFTASCYACTVNGFWCSNRDIGLQIDASCYRMIISGFLESPLSGATYSIQIGAGAIVTLIDPQVTTATNFQSGGSYINQVTDNGLTVSGTVSAGTLSGKVVDATGITGATAASRYAGATTSGAPTSGTFSKGDHVIDQSGAIWICTTAGTVGSGAVFTQVGGGGGSVSSVTAGDTSIVVGGTGSAPTIETGTLDVIATDHPPAAAWSNNSKKITNVANGSASTDVAAFGQIPTAGTGSTNFTAGNATVSGDLSGSLPSPTVAKVNGVSVSGTPSLGQTIVASGSSAASWGSITASGVPTVFNVKDAAYGATGNGTTNDAPAIQSAITACTSAGGGIVYFPVGTYLISSTLVVNADMVELVGAGWGAILSAGSGLANTAMIHYEGPGSNFRFGCRIANLQLIGNSVTGVSGIQLDSTYYAKIDYVSVTYCPATSIYLNGTSSYFGAYTHISDSVIGQGGAGTGILTNNHEFNTVESTVINWFNSTGGIGINWTGGNNVTVGCTFDECQTAAVCSFSKENTFSSCEFDRSYITFIYLEAAIDCTVSNCYFGDFKGTGTQSIITNNNNSGACTVSGSVTLPGTGWTYFIDEAFGTFTAPNLYINNQVGSYGFVLNSGQGANTSILRGNIGYNPLTVTAPAFPATTVTYTNTTGVDVMAYVTNGTVAMTTQLNGATGPSIAASATASIFIPATGTFKATYASGSPAWVFVGN